MTEEKQISNYPIHIKLNTGMNRLGFDSENIEELKSILKNKKSIIVKSILSHMAASDDLTHDEFNRKQIFDFEQMANQIKIGLGINPILHMANTSGISNYPEAQFDMVRLGIGIYGVSNDEKETALLENVGVLKSIISQIRTLQVGESIGYGRRFIAQQETKVARLTVS